MATKNTNKNKTKSVQPTQNVKQPKEKKRNIYHLFIKLIVFALILLAVVLFTDYKGYFVSNLKNNHTELKWKALYKFTKKNNVDVVLVGNSSLYTAINPKHLSCTLGANCFVLASPGTTLSDAYFCIKEALSVSKPKIVVVETNAIFNYDSYNLNPDQLSNQLQSFSARKNVLQKMESMPLLFKPDNYLSAWSNTIRNHSFIISDREQIKKNVDHKNKLKEEKGLYLGRYVRFTSGIQDSTLRKYKLPETPKDNGDEFEIGDEAKTYLSKIAQLCKENDVKLVFLTVPIYQDLVVNYEAKRSKIQKAIAPYDALWLDLQKNYNTNDYKTDCFENIASRHQHLTLIGSLVTSYKLAGFIHDSLPNTLEDRSNNPQWLSMFHGEEGYFENYMPNKNDSAKIEVLLKNGHIQEIPNVIKEVDLKKDKKVDVLYLKIDKEGKDLHGKTVQLFLMINDGSKTFPGIVNCQLAREVDPVKHYLFVSNLKKGFKIIQINGLKVI